MCTFRNLSTIAREDVRGKLPVHSWRERRLVQSLWKPAWKVLRQLWIDLAHDSAILLLGISLHEMKSAHEKAICNSTIKAAQFTIVKIQKQPRCQSTDQWIKKVWNIYLIECSWTIKKNETLPSVTKCLQPENITFGVTGKS